MELLISLHIYILVIPNQLYMLSVFNSFIKIIKLIIDIIILWLLKQIKIVY